MRGFFSRIAGIATLSLRSSLRTRTVAALLVLLLATVLFLPRLIHGDGTASGELKILLSYTLGFAFGILALSSLWSACSLFAAEIDTSRIQLTIVKPVRKWELWLGRWIALLLLNALALAAVYGGIYAQVRWRFSGNDALEYPTSQYVVRPILPTVAESALQAYNMLASESALPTNLTKRAILRALEQKESERYDVINPGDAVGWDFTLDHPIRFGDLLTVRLKFDTEFSTREHIQGECVLSSPDCPGLAVQVELDDFTQNEILFSVDTGELPKLESGQGVDASALPERLSRFRLDFRNKMNAKRGGVIMTRFRRDVALLTPGGTFGGNLFRSALVHLCVLGVLSAFGLTLSACLSLPVAAFTATVLLSLCMVGNAVVKVVSQEDEEDWRNLPGIWISRAVNRTTTNVLPQSPLSMLTANERVGLDYLAAVAGWDLLVLPGFLMIFGCYVLSRREIG